jgi:transposase
MTMTGATAYRIIDSRTGQQVGRDYAPRSRQAAYNRADRMDQAFGAVRYIVQPVWGA